MKVYRPVHLHRLTPFPIKPKSSIVPSFSHWIESSEAGRHHGGAVGRVLPIASVRAVAGYGNSNPSTSTNGGWSSQPQPLTQRYDARLCRAPPVSVLRSMVALALPHFPAEHPIDEHDVAEDDRQ